MSNQMNTNRLAIQSRISTHASARPLVGRVVRGLALAAACFWALAGLPQAASAQQISPKLYQDMRWRCIGPFRAGRTVGAAGVPSQPNVFYIGVNNGGVWKTTDAGRTWVPIFDDQPTGSIGDLAVAQSDPNVIYVGSGEGLQRPDLSVGDGIYKSADGGKTWRNVGLRDAQQIASVIIDPRDANRVFVAALGHPYGPNPERGVFRSLDGGATWKKVLYKDENTGAVQVQFDPMNPDVLYADLWESRQGPWENGAWQGLGSGLYKSADGGNTWLQLTNGLPTAQQGLGRIGIGISRSNPNILFATVDAPKLGGVFRSDDAGESWRLINNDPRTWGRGGDFAEVKVHPKNPDIVYIANTSSYRSTDGGKTFVGFKGAPGGDDYHRIWINPENPDIMLFTVDQGATITVNGGETWSSWYNQPTAQFYHVITDNRFPYWVYGAQQESGSIGIASRGDYGGITWQDWRTVGAEEYGYVAPDPLNPNIIYGGKLSRYDWTTGQSQNIAPEAIHDDKYRFLRTEPVIFSPVDPHVLYYAGNVLFKTTSGGHDWEVISPDLSREQPEVPANIGDYRTPEMAKMARRGVIYTVAPSHQNVKSIWVGTDDGLIHITRDGGKTWSNVTPPELSPWSKVSLIDAGHFDSKTAYAAINRLRLDDLRPHILRTHDGGKTWKEITQGIDVHDVVNAVREDPVRPGLLFAGTERAVYVSFDDGDQWHQLRLNMPATSIRDLVIHNDDVVVGTHGRSFWILDDITPLRQISEKVASADAFLFKPQLAYRLRRSVNTDTPIPPEEPMGQNPPDGAIINYYLKSDAANVVLEILDKGGSVVRRFSSADKPEEINNGEQPYPSYWFRPAQILSAKAGMRRFVWDLHYPSPEGLPRSFPISAIYRDTPSGPLGPTILPGDYTVKLTVDGRSQIEKLVVKMDPRVATTAQGLAKMFAISMRAYEGMKQAHQAMQEIQKLRAQVKERHGQSDDGGLSEAIAKLDGNLVSLEGASSGRAGGRRGTPVSSEQTFAKLEGELNSLMGLVEAADATPTAQAVAASEDLQRALARLLVRWKELQSGEVKTLNESLHKVNLPGVLNHQ
ncbi:MAG: glycosyl hydrolase repeat-containing protein [Pedosphaera sp.]|nr:glycosyl hydrolase repeat-containing protein [Pedosphaera sp.]